MYKKEMKYFKTWKISSDNNRKHYTTEWAFHRHDYFNLLKEHIVRRAILMYCTTYSTTPFLWMLVLHAS